MSTVTQSVGLGLFVLGVVSTAKVPAGGGGALVDFTMTSLVVASTVPTVVVAAVSLVTPFVVGSGVVGFTVISSEESELESELEARFEADSTLLSKLDSMLDLTGLSSPNVSYRGLYRPYCQFFG